ncbi:uncharacterized protein LOC119837259 [Zerene cesonia]|uniref:uncharacterized protein LOC119837259 n=1 Tax=Zerene cesonia TaxID=33412 RepID=UPI0018E544F6|nr:uncharacterized protein LOC119837259 [Zerene cesonia]
MHNYKMLITFNEIINAQTLIECKTFKDMEWRCYMTSEVGISYGVIRDIDLDVSDEDILNNLRCELEIVSIKRLNKRNSEGTAQWVRCEALRLGFKGNTIPTHVFLYGLGVKVDPYIFPVTQCSRCWKYGHSRFQCSSTRVICPKCSRNHENCEATVFRCVNCTGNHMALQKVCPVFQKERRIRELMSEFNCTFRKALSIYVPPSPVAGNNTDPEQQQIHLDEFPCLPTQTEKDPPVEEEAHSPKELMSHLFTKPKKRSLLKKKQYRPPSPFTAPEPTQVEMNWSEESDKNEEQERDQENVRESRENSKKDLGFIRLLTNLYKIVICKDSIEIKMQRAVIMYTEWVLHKVMSGISAKSTFKSFCDDG